MNVEDDYRRIENAYVAARRSEIDQRHPELGLASRTYRVGLSLSGGGIRSATLSLGVLESLSRLKLIHNFDYLSTVSGGGYAGAFYGSLFVPPAARGAQTLGWKSPAVSADPLGEPLGKAGIRHLRENGRYLSPGSGDNLRLMTIAIRGWLAVQLAIGVALVTAFLAFNLLRAILAGSSQLHTYELSIAKQHEMALIWPIEWLRGYPVGEAWVLSPLIPVLVVPIAVSVALGWAYWLTRYDTISRHRIIRALGPSTIGTVLIAILCIGWPPAEPDELHVAVLIVGGLAAMAAVFYVSAQLMAFRKDRRASQRTNLGRGDSDRAEEESRVRNIITTGTARTLMIAGVIAAFALVETVSQTLYVMFLEQSSWRGAVSIAAIAGAAIPLVRQIVGQVQKSGDFAGFVRRFGRMIALLSALAIAFVITSCWATLAQYLAWRGGGIGGLPSLIPMKQDWQLSTLVGMTLAFAVVAVSVNMSVGFLNLSTFSAFYAGRLRRAYLGASNPDRSGASSGVREEDQGDDITLREYYAGQPPGSSASGAPMHLINLTLNETQGGKAGLVQRDRKGRPMTISPAGYLVPTEDGITRFSFHAELGEEHARGKTATRAGQAWDQIASRRTDLPLSNWVAISGAALSTGLGRNTSLGLSLLAGLSNLRLGVWWPRPDAGKMLSIDPRQGVFPYLWREFTASFAGVRGRRWYLTDGGHFENTGVYELVRREVELIVCCDNGADPDYLFDDIVNLARKLRIDFNAQLEFLPASKLDALMGKDAADRGMFGELGELVRYSKGTSGHGPYAAIARILGPPRKDSAEPAYCGTLILLKPRLTGLEMIDLVDYHRVDRTFPQQTTSDQFFDEAQWESYYRLGSTIADRVFGTFADRDRPWSPARLEPIPVSKFDWFSRPWPGERPGEGPGERQCSSGAGEAAAPAGMPTPAGMGTSGFLLTLIAGLGTAGIATGVGQSLTNVAVQSFTSSSQSGKAPPTPPTAPPAGADVFMEGLVTNNSGRSKVTLESDAAERLRTIAGQLDSIIAQTRSEGTGDLLAQLVALRLTMQTYLRSQDPRVLQRILAQITGLRQETVASNSATRGELRRLDTSLQQVSQSVREVSPRRNIRGGSQ